MKSYNIKPFAPYVAIVGIFSAYLYLRHGWLAVICYLIFAAICITPSVMLARKYLREEGGDAQ